MSYDVVAVANTLVDLDARAHGGKSRLTNMALQKLLYFAEGEYLAETGRSLFDSPIEAWEYGPVVPDAYHAFKSSGSKPITGKVSTVDADGGLWRWVTPTLPPSARREREIVTGVYNRLGKLPAAKLMAASHAAGGPWSRVYKAGGRHIEIPRSLLRSYFAAHPILG